MFTRKRIHFGTLALVGLGAYLLFLNATITYLIEASWRIGVPFKPTMLVALFYSVGSTSVLMVTPGVIPFFLFLFFMSLAIADEKDNWKSSLLAAARIQLWITVTSMILLTIWHFYSPFISVAVQYPHTTLAAVMTSFLFKIIEVGTLILT